MMLILLMEFLERNKMEKDIFGFADAIELDHLSNEQLKLVEEIFKDFK